MRLAAVAFLPMLACAQSAATMVLRRVAPTGAPERDAVGWVRQGISFSVQAHDAWMLLITPDRPRTLAAVVSASGAKYEGDGARFWSQGDEALLELDGKVSPGCRALP